MAGFYETAACNPTSDTICTSTTSVTSWVGDSTFPFGTTSAYCLDDGFVSQLVVFGSPGLVTNLCFACSVLGTLTERFSFSGGYIDTYYPSPTTATPNPVPLTAVCMTYSVADMVIGGAVSGFTGLALYISANPTLVSAIYTGQQWAPAGTLLGVSASLSCPPGQYIYGFNASAYSTHTLPNVYNFGIYGLQGYCKMPTNCPVNGCGPGQMVLTCNVNGSASSCKSCGAPSPGMYYTSGCNQTVNRTSSPQPVTSSQMQVTTSSPMQVTTSRMPVTTSSPMPVTTSSPLPVTTSSPVPVTSNPQPVTQPMTSNTQPVTSAQPVASTRSTNPTLITDRKTSTTTEKIQLSQTTVEAPPPTTTSSLVYTLVIGLSYPSGASNPTLDQLKVAIGGSLGVSPAFVDVSVTSTTRRRLLGTVSVTARVSFPSSAAAGAAQAKISLVKSLQVNGVSVSVVSAYLLDPGQTSMPSTTPTPSPGSPGVSQEVIIVISVVIGLVLVVGFIVIIIYAARKARPMKGRVVSDTTRVNPPHGPNAQLVFHNPVAVRIQLTPDRYLSGPRLSQVFNRPLFETPYAK